MSTNAEIQALVDAAMADIYAPAPEPAQVPEWIPPNHETIDVSTIASEELAVARLDPDTLDIFDDLQDGIAVAQEKIAAAPVLDMLRYLQLLFEPGDWINLQFIHQTKKWKDDAGNLHAEIDNNFMTLEDALRKRTLQSIAVAQADGWNSYIAMNAFTPGLEKRRVQDVKDVRTVYLDFDHDGEAGIAKINADVAAGLIAEPHFILQSSLQKFYAIWRVEKFTVAQQEALNSALQQRYGSDPAACDAARVLRLPGTRNLKYEQQPIVEVIRQGCRAERYTLKDFKIELSAAPKNKKEVRRNEAGLVPHHSIHPYMVSVAGKLREDGLEVDEIEPILLRMVHEECAAPIDESKVKTCAQSMQNYAKGSPASKMILFPPPVAAQPTQPIIEKAMPDPLAIEAYHGVAGCHLRNIEKNSEAHPAGILALFLSGFGSIVGMDAYMRVEDNLHFPMVNIIVTGQSSRSRKDTAMGRALRPLKAADPLWAGECIKQGFSSGEAVVAYFTTRYKMGMPVRLFVTDTEFKTTLTICAREGNTLSEVYRHMFNADALEVNTKKDSIGVPCSCGTSAGLITKAELRDVLKESEMVSGFVNRYMTILVHRVKKISRPARVTDPAIIAERVVIETRLKMAVQWVKVGANEIDPVDKTKGLRMTWGDEAGEAWDKFYNNLGDEDADYLTRAEVMVMRLAMIYALLDMASVIELVHLNAALAVWHYAEQSSRLVYEDTQPSNVIKVMNRALSAGNLKRAAVYNMFNRNFNAEHTNWIMEEAIQLSRGRLEAVMGVYKGEAMIAAIQLKKQR
jgi:hypothetical protein